MNFKTFKNFQEWEAFHQKQNKKILPNLNFSFFWQIFLLFGLIASQLKIMRRTSDVRPKQSYFRKVSTFQITNCLVSKLLRERASQHIKFSNNVVFGHHMWLIRLFGTMYGQLEHTFSLRRPMSQWSVILVQLNCGLNLLSLFY